MARKVIIDCDPGIDGAVALAMALFEPKVEIVAITATAGNVPAAQASRNVQAVIEQLDPPRLPRVGFASPLDNAPSLDNCRLHGGDGLGNAGFAVSQLHQRHASDKVICDAVRAAPDEVTIVALGPLTNIARAFQRDPGLPGLVSRIIISGGSLVGIGDATAAAEYSMFYDPESARTVFRSATTKTLVPLEIAQQVHFGLGLIDELPDSFSRAGRFLRKILPFFFRAHHQALGLEEIRFLDAVAFLATVHDELFETEELAGDVETCGELTMGATIFDRRSRPKWRRNMEVATSVDAVAARDGILRALKVAGESTPGI